MKASLYMCMALLGSCMVGPDYQAPAPSMPTSFAEIQESNTNDSSLCQWWKQFQDPLLDKLIEEAALANYDVRIAIEKIVQARAQYRVQRSYLWPEIDLNAVATRSRNSQNLFTTPGATSSGSTSTTTESSVSTFQNFFLTGFDAIWEFDFFGKFRRAKRSALYQWEASQEDAQSVLISILSEVARNYITICAIQEKISLLTQKIQADQEELSLIASLFISGLNSQIQLAEITAILEADTAQLPILEASLKTAIYSLAILLGRQPETLLTTFTESHPIPSGFNKIPAGLPSDLLRRRPDIKSAERMLAAATENIGVAVADLFPHIALTGSTLVGGSLGASAVGYESGSLSSLLKPASSFWSIGPAIRWDLIDFGRTKGNIAIQNSIQRQALLTYEKTVISALQDVESALAAYFEEQKRHSSLEAQVLACKTTLELTDDLYHSGLANAQDVLEAKKTFLDAQSTLTDSTLSTTRDLISIYKALGGNWECSYLP